MFILSLFLLNMIDKWCKNFIWSGHIGLRKLVTVPWSVVYSSLAAGGLGLKSIKSINKAPMMKLCWELISTNDQWLLWFEQEFS